MKKLLTKENAKAVGMIALVVIAVLVIREQIASAIAKVPVVGAKIADKLN